MLPPRTHFCLSCRTALVHGESCDLCGTSTVVPLETADGRASAEAAACSTTTRTEVRPWLIRATFLVVGVGGTAATVAFVAVSLKSEWSIGGGVYIIATLCWMLSWPLIPWIPHRFQKTVQTRTPRSVRKRASPPKVTEMVGTVLGDDDVVAEAFVVQYDDEVMFRDAFSLGFELETERGRVLVPEGRIGVLATGGDAMADDEIRARLTHHGLSSEQAEAIVPFTSAWAWRLRSGEKVRLFADVAKEAQADATYREPTKTQWRALGVAWLKPAGP